MNDLSAKSLRGSRLAHLSRLSLLLKHGYVVCLKSVAALLPKSVPSTQALVGVNRWRHWLASLTRIHDFQGMAELDVPWWTYNSIGHIESWMSLHSKPIRVFEYGSGASTVWLSRRVGSVTTVEHDAGFAEAVRPYLAGLTNVTFEYRPPQPSASPEVASRKAGNQGLDFSDYVSSLDRQSGSFDMIIIDGRSREACLTVAERHLARDGMIVFDNTRRRRYRKAIDASPFIEKRFPGLTPSLPYPDQTSLMFWPDAQS